MEKTILILKHESDRLEKEAKEAASLYHQNRRLVKNRIRYAELTAQLVEINRLCLLLNVDLDTVYGEQIKQEK